MHVGARCGEGADSEGVVHERGQPRVREARGTVAESGDPGAGSGSVERPQETTGRSRGARGGRAAPKAVPQPLESCSRKGGRSRWGGGGGAGSGEMGRAPVVGAEKRRLGSSEGVGYLPGPSLSSSAQWEPCAVQPGGLQHVVPQPAGTPLGSDGRPAAPPQRWPIAQQGARPGASSQPSPGDRQGPSTAAHACRPHRQIMN